MKDDVVPALLVLGGDVYLTGGGHYYGPGAGGGEGDFTGDGDHRVVSWLVETGNNAFELTQVFPQGQVRQ